MTRVLVVEDEESFSDALSYLLRREGYDVEVADTGPAALTVFDRRGADVATARSTRSSASSSVPTTT